MFQENDVVAVKGDYPDRNISAGQVGTVICCFTVPDEAYEVEFADEEGRPIAQFALRADELVRCCL
ncbi:MAG: DUF4926 domain-containing protein [Coriobacteriia bacterium]|nr:DUF4926 domain-containing protein [Coriobacteriia bacterium]